MKCPACNDTGFITKLYSYGFRDEPCNCEAGDEEPMDIETLGEAIRGQFPEMIEKATGSEVCQLQDEELVVWGGYGFRVQLTDGTSLDITLNRR